MKTRFFHSIKAQIIILVTIAVTLSTGIASGIIIYFNYQNTLSQMKTDGLSIVKSNTAYILERVKQNNSKIYMQNVVEDIAKDQKLSYCVLLSDNFIDICDSDIKDIGKIFDDNNTKNVITYKRETTGFWINSEGEKILDIMIPINFTIENETIAAINIGLPIDALNQTMMKSIVRSIIISILSIIIFSVIVLIFMEKIIIKPIEKVTEITEKLSKGNIAVNLDFKGYGEIGQLIKAFNNIINRTKEQSLVAQSISDGNLEVEIRVQSSEDILANGLNNMTTIINSILQEIKEITKEVCNGNLNIRGDANKFNGSWKVLVSEINELIDAFVTPINVTAEYVNRISKGDIPPKITDTYHGDFNEIKNNLNNCIEVMSGLLNETNKLINAAKEGELDTRGNVSAFTGGWGELVSGINNLFEAVVKPIKEVAVVMNGISNGNLDVAVKGDYKGEFGELAKYVNNTIRSLKGVVEEISGILGEISSGNLAIENVKKFDGSFENISISLNTIVGSLNVVFPVK